MSETVLLTGASGFIGRHVVPALLARGYEVHGIARRGTVISGCASSQACDLFDDGAVESLIEVIRPTHLLHFAWYAEHGKFWSSEENLRWVRASLNLIQRFTAAGGK